MSNKPLPQQIYRHFKGNLYRIVTLATHSETREEMVIYQALYGDYQVYARPLSMFMEKVDRNKYPEVNQEYRFELIPELLQAQATELPKETCTQENMQEAAETSESEKSVVEPSVVETPIAEPQLQTADCEPEEEFHLDPLVLEFLDADTYEERLNIMAGIHHRVTDEMINTMALSIDVEIGEGDIEERYEELKYCLLTREKFECNRMR